jgi:hypothetical protein
MVNAVRMARALARATSKQLRIDDGFSTRTPENR